MVCRVLARGSRLVKGNLDSEGLRVELEFQGAAWKLWGSGVVSAGDPK